MNIQTSPGPLENFEIFKVVAKYLSQKDLLDTMLLNRQFYHLSIKFMKLILRQQGLLEHLDQQLFKRNTKDKIISQISETQSPVENDQSETLDANQGNNKDIQIVKKKKETTDTLPYNLVYKHFYGRETLIASMNQGLDAEKFSESLIPFRRAHTYGYAVKEFKLGQRFAAFLTYSNELIFFLAQDYLEKVHQTPSLNKRQDIKKFSVLGRNNLVYLTQQGVVIIVFYDPVAGLLTEQAVQLTLQVPILDIEHSYNITVMVIDHKNAPKEKQNEYNFKLNSLLYSNRVGQDDEVPIEQLNETIMGFVLFMSELNPENINDGFRYRKILGYPFQETKSISVGAQNIYILSPDQKIYQSDISATISASANQNPQFIIENFIINKDPPIIRVFLNDNFTGKHIVALYSGMSYFFALARQQIKPIQEWNNEQLIEWLNANKFSDYSKVVRYNQLDGLEFSRMAIDKKFMVETLGMTREDLQVKLSTDISRASKRTWKSYSLYGWGRNDFGQLGLAVSNNIQMTVSVPIPQFDLYDEIIRIECGWKNSAFITKKGRIFMTETYINKKAEVAVQKINEDQQQGEKKNRKKSSQEVVDDQKKSQSFQQGGKKNKNIYVEVQQESKQFVMKMRWVEITSAFTTLKDSREFQKFDISLTKDYLAVLTVCVGNLKLQELRKLNSQKPQVESKYNEGNAKKPFKSADKVLDRILWDPTLNKEEFIVGYEDRFLGIMEIPIDDYQQSEIKFHRIQYFKRNDQIVWDRQKKIDLLNI